MAIFSKIISKVFGNKTDKDLKKLEPYIHEIDKHYVPLSTLSDDDLKSKFSSMKSSLHDQIYQSKNQFVEQKMPQEEIDNKLYQIEQDYLNSHMPEVFAIIKDACRRLYGSEYTVMGQPSKWVMIPYDVQLIGGVVLHQGNIAEMKTGEGKTLVSTLPIILNAMTDRGVHIITVNDYLAERDSQWMGLLYEYLGLSVGCILNQMDPDTRKEMYKKNITYGTNSQFGFDYLRDNMSIKAEQQVQRGHAFAIVDEVDSVLIDEARTPLIISGQINSSKNEKFTEWRPSIDSLIKKQSQHTASLLSDIDDLLESDKMEAGRKMLLVQRGQPKNKKLLKLYQQTGIKQLIAKVESEYIRDKKLNELDEELYFSIDERSNIIDLSENGRNFLSPDEPEMFVLPDLGESFHSIEKKYDNPKQVGLEKEKIQTVHSERSERMHVINQLLRAFSLFEKDNEYIVQDGKVLIVDQHTGRVMHGRQFSDGMHQAIEAKENVTIQRETQTVATITIQNYFRMYEKLAGMTGTASTEASEFMEIYKLEVIEMPTNKPIQRKDHQDFIYKTRKEKYKAVIDKISDLYKSGQPVLVGTTSVEESEFLARMMKSSKLPHNVLNAKQHQSEADIIARAGLQNSITISTNMAGRGTDIKLGEEVQDLGGLFILGTGRHESRRIDLQLRGRSGRQGDKGESIFYLSLEDNLMRLFGSERIAKVMDTLGLKEGEVITHSMVTKSIERAQKKIEAMNFGSRKHLIEYDDIMNYQREIVYNRRNYALHEEDISNELDLILDEYLDDFVAEHCNLDNWSYDNINNELLNTFGLDLNIDSKVSSINDVKRQINDACKKLLKFKNDNSNPDMYNEYKKFIILKTIDSKWQDHLYMMDQLREGINLRAYGQKNPLIEYKQEGFKMFEEMMSSTNKETLKRIFRVDISNASKQQAQPIQSATNLTTKRDSSILPAMPLPQNQQDQGPASPNPLMPQQRPVAPNQKRTPIKVDRKIGRNDKVQIQKGSESKIIKFKKADSYLNDGWKIIE